MAENKKETARSEEGLGIAGFTLGVLSIIFAGSPGLVISIVSLIICRMQQKQHRMKLAKIGIILAIIGLILSIILIVGAILINTIPAVQQQIQRYAQLPG